MENLHRHSQWQLLFSPGQHVRDQTLQRGGQARHDGDGQGHQGGVQQYSQVSVIFASLGIQGDSFDCALGRRGLRGLVLHLKRSQCAPC